MKLIGNWAQFDSSAQTDTCHSRQMKS